MKRFSEYLEDKEDQLDEGIIRTGSVAVLAARSNAAAKKSDREFKQGLTALEAQTRMDDANARLSAIEAALKALLRGQLHRSDQTRNHVALDTIGHLAKGNGKSRR